MSVLFINQISLVNGNRLSTHKKLNDLYIEQDHHKIILIIYMVLCYNI